MAKQKTCNHSVGKLPLRFRVIHDRHTEHKTNMYSAFNQLRKLSLSLGLLTLNTSQKKKKKKSAVKANQWRIFFFSFFFKSSLNKELLLCRFYQYILTLKAVVNSDSPKNKKIQIFRRVIRENIWHHRATGFSFPCHSIDQLLTILQFF